MATSTPSPHLSLPTFSSKPEEDFGQFLFDFDLACKANDWPDPTQDDDLHSDDLLSNTYADHTTEKRHIMLQRSLRGKAARILLTLDDDTLRNYRLLRSTLLHRFLPVEYRALRRTELRTRRCPHWPMTSISQQVARIPTAMTPLSTTSRKMPLSKAWTTNFARRFSMLTPPILVLRCVERWLRKPTSNV